MHSLVQPFRPVAGWDCPASHSLHALSPDALLAPLGRDDRAMTVDGLTPGGQHPHASFRPEHRKAQFPHGASRRRNLAVGAFFCTTALRKSGPYCPTGKSLHSESLSHTPGDLAIPWSAMLVPMIATGCCLRICLACGPATKAFAGRGSGCSRPRRSQGPMLSNLPLPALAAFPMLSWIVPFGARPAVALRLLVLVPPSRTRGTTGVLPPRRCSPVLQLRTPGGALFGSCCSCGTTPLQADPSNKLMSYITHGALYAVVRTTAFTRAAL